MLIKPEEIEQPEETFSVELSYVEWLLVLYALGGISGSEHKVFNDMIQESSVDRKIRTRWISNEIESDKKQG